MDVLKLDIRVEEDQMQKGAVKILKEIKPFWDTENVCFKDFTEGLNNKLIGCYEENSKDDMVLIRVNGPKTERFIDRDHECASTVFLHEQGLASKVYAQFNNGLAYEFFPGITMDAERAKDPKMFPMICDAIAKMHSLAGPKGYVFQDTIDSMFKHIPTSFSDPETQVRFEKEVGTKEEIGLELVQLRDALHSTNYPLVFAHNDIALENIVYNETLDVVRLIDFEYAGYSIQPYEIASHFMQHAGTADIDYDLCPNKKFQLAWIKEYLKRYKYYTERRTEDVSDKEVEDLQITVEKFSVAYYFVVALWAMVQINEASREFDYLGLAIQLMNQYKKNKSKLIK